MSLTKKRWIILFVYCLINLCVGSIYAWSVFSVPMEEFLNAEYGRNLSPGSLSSVFMVTSTLGPLVMIVGGKINDSIGPRWLILFGGIVFGIGIFASGFATNTTMLMVTYGVGCGFGMGSTYCCTIGNSVKFFPDKRGFAGGIATASFGISAVLVPPIANALIDSIGIVNTFKVLGVLFFVIICAGAFLVEKCPDGFKPDGWEPPEERAEFTLGKMEYEWKDMLKTPVFYIMMLTLLCGTLSGMMCISQTSGIAQEMIGLSVAVAALCVSLLSLFNTGARIVAGTISDKIGRVNTLLIGFILSIIGLVLMFISNSTLVFTFYIAIALVGLSYGSIMGTFPAFTADQFGSANNSVNYGIMCIGFSASGFLGPMIMRIIHENQGIYNNAFILAAAFSVAGIILLLVYKKIMRSRR